MLSWYELVYSQRWKRQVLDERSVPELPVVHIEMNNTALTAGQLSGKALINNLSPALL